MTLTLHTSNTSDQIWGNQKCNFEFPGVGDPDRTHEEAEKVLLP